MFDMTKTLLMRSKSFKAPPPLDGSGQAFLRRVYAERTNEGKSSPCNRAFKSPTADAMRASRGQVPNVKKGVKRFYATWIVALIYRLVGNHRSELAFCFVREKLFKQAHRLATD